MAIEEIRHECRACHGSKLTDCSKCKGDREIKCNSCGGAGTMVVRGEREKCSSCKGYGKIKCYSCNGRGGHKCSSCQGMGYTVERRVNSEGHKHSTYPERDSSSHQSPSQGGNPIALVSIGLLAVFAALFGAWFAFLR